MNKFYKWRYDKTRNKMLMEIEEYGLRILDEDKFNKHVRQSVRRDTIYNLIFIALIIWIAIKWFMILNI